MRAVLGLEGLTREDIKKWYKDYREVKVTINDLINKVSNKPVEEQADYLLDRLHHNNAFDICSDTSTEPIEYIDFNYGSIRCTISFYDRNVGELLSSFDGYITREFGEEVYPYEDISIDDVVEELIEGIYNGNI